MWLGGGYSGGAAGGAPTVTIMFKVLDTSIRQAFYELSLPDQQLHSYVLNNARGRPRVGGGREG